MMKRFKEMSLSKKFLTVVVLLLATCAAFLFLPLYLAAVLLVYSAVKIVLKIMNKQYIGCIPFICLILLGLTALDWGLYSSSYDSSSSVATATPTVEPVATEEADEVEATDEVEETAEPTVEPTEEPVEEDLPEYEVYSVDDTSIGSVVRKTLNIVVTDEYTLDELYNIAEKEINAYIKSTKVNAIVAGFFTTSNHIGYGYDMGRVEYVPNGNFSDAVDVTAGDYSSFEFVDYLEEELDLPKGEDLQVGASDLDQIKSDFEETYDDCSVTVSLSNGTLYVTATESEDQYFTADENAISVYTDYALDNFMDDIQYLDITVVRPSSSVSALLDMDMMDTDFGRYFNTFYIAENLK